MCVLQLQCNVLHHVYGTRGKCENSQHRCNYYYSLLWSLWADSAADQEDQQSYDWLFTQPGTLLHAVFWSSQSHSETFFSYTHWCAAALTHTEQRVQLGELNLSLIRINSSWKLLDKMFIDAKTPHPVGKGQLWKDRADKQHVLDWKCLLS